MSTSKNHLAALPNSLSWSIACPAPFWRSSGGRSAVKQEQRNARLVGLDRRRQSSATAVPDVHATATGSPEALASPSAKKPEQRSSTWEKHRSRGSRASDSTSGAQRDPGDVQAARIPHRASSSTNALRSR